MAGEARSTAAGGYVELDPINAVRSTASGGYVELDPINAIRSTAAGAYVELLAPPNFFFIGRIGRFGARANVPVVAIDDHVSMLFQNTRTFYAE